MVKLLVRDLRSTRLAFLLKRSHTAGAGSTATVVQWKRITVCCQTTQASIVHTLYI